MARHPAFLSVVISLHDAAAQMVRILSQIQRSVSALATDYEIIVVDNASTDQSVETLKCLTKVDGLPNLQVFALTKRVDADTASCIGIENALGDFVVVFNPEEDDICFVSDMLERASDGADVVFAANMCKRRETLSYRLCYAAFNALHKLMIGVNLSDEAPRFRLLSRKVVNFILRHPHPALAYRHLPVTGGFSRAKLSYHRPVEFSHEKRNVLAGVDRGIRLLVSTTRAPMRFVTGLSLFGAVTNVIYSGYIIAVWLLKSDVAPGWVTLSLQQSGMFFLISLVLLVLGEYIVQIVSLSNEGPLYHVAQEFTSALMTHRERLNVEEADPCRTRVEASIS